MIKAKRLLRGESIGVVSPYCGGAGRFPHRVERGVKQLEALGCRVKLGRHALNTQEILEAAVTE
jgi:muramoyltetrapeptide carboxypeptidase